MKERLRLQAALALGAVLVAGCSGSEVTPIQATASNPTLNTEKEHTLAASDGNYFITKISNSRNMFLVSRGDTVYNAPDSVFVGEGERYMAEQGCDIIEIDRVMGGDVIYTAPDKNCLPQLK